MPKFDDYWFDDYDGRPPHEGEHHGEPHDHPYDDYPYHHHPHPPFDGRRHRPVDMGKVDTTKMHNRYDMFVPYHMPPWGFKFPKLEKAFVPGSTPQEQVAYLLNRVDTMIDYFNHYDDKVWGAYNAVVHSALGNEAYYREITREEGYLADGSTPYTVIHIPYLDRAERPIFLELGLAYNNTTNNGVKENVFEASQNRVADKLIPAFNIADGWEGKAMLKGAPIQSTYTEGKFTLAVTDNGFLKIYPNTVSYDQLNRDRIRNAMGVQGVLINNGAKTPEQYATNGGELLARVGIGMNYETKERLIVIVNGNPTPPNDASVTGATADMLADIFARYNCTVAVETANNGSAVAMDKGQMIYMPDTATTGVIPTVPSINCYWYITKRRHYHNQYVKDVADLIQKVGQNKWRCEIALQSCDFLKGRVNDLQRDLDAEVQTRKDANEQLQNNIDAEAETRRLADAQLQDNIDAETNARVAGDNALDERITNEVSIINTRIDTVVGDFNNAIATERQARIDGDTALGTRIDNEVVTINARIDTEVATLNALIDAEEQARIAGDTALENSLTQLREDYTAFLTTYANDLAETRRITTALRSDITTIQGQIAELQSNLSAVNTSITAILATINTIEQSFENIKTAFTEMQEDWHDYKDSVDVEIAQLKQEWADFKTQITNSIQTLLSNYVLKSGDTMTGPLVVDSGSTGSTHIDGNSVTFKRGTNDVTISKNNNDRVISFNDPTIVRNVSNPVSDDDAVNYRLIKSYIRNDTVTFYIDPNNGSDNNDGLTNSTPFKTLAKAVSTAPRCIYSGSVHIYLAEGEYDEVLNLNSLGNVTLYLAGDVTFNGIYIFNCAVRVTSTYNIVINDSSHNDEIISSKFICNKLRITNHAASMHMLAITNSSVVVEESFYADSEYSPFSPFICERSFVYFKNIGTTDLENRIGIRVGATGHLYVGSGADNLDVHVEDFSGEYVVRGT